MPDNRTDRAKLLDDLGALLMGSMVLSVGLIILILSAMAGLISVG